MALAKARRITVAGRKYQWKVSTNGHFHLAVLDPTNNRRLIVYFEEHQTISPKVVRAFILEAETLGWTGQVRWDR